MTSASAIEIINRNHPTGPFRAAIFDFDGTLSLLRKNWQNVMIPMMVDILAETGTNETREELRTVVETFVMRLNGKQTIYQMIELVSEVEKRGGVAKEPIAYKYQYHEKLSAEVGKRVEAARSGEVSKHQVLGSRQILELLSNCGLKLYLASGTDRCYVEDELQVLELDSFFGEHVYGAIDDYQNFSKAMIISQMIEDAGYSGNEIVGFGDGFVEIEEVKRVGGLAVGVASNEETRQGIDRWKRKRLIDAGADVIISDYCDVAGIQKLLGLEQ